MVQMKIEGCLIEFWNYLEPFIRLIDSTYTQVETEKIEFWNYLEPVIRLMVSTYTQGETKKTELKKIVILKMH